MRKLINQIKHRIAVDKQQVEIICNYNNNYYGDQLCQSADSNH